MFRTEKRVDGKASMTDQVVDHDAGVSFLELLLKDLELLTLSLGSRPLPNVVNIDLVLSSNHDSLKEALPVAEVIEPSEPILDRVCGGYHAESAGLDRHLLYLLYFFVAN